MTTNESGNSSYKMVEGKAEKTETQTITLIPQRKGRYRISPAIVEHKGKRILTNRIVNTIHIQIFTPNVY